jgi:hypothetical protein
LSVMRMQIATSDRSRGFARFQSNHDREANLYYKEYVIYSAHSRLLVSLNRRATINHRTVVEN